MHITSDGSAEFSRSIIPTFLGFAVCFANRYKTPDCVLFAQIITKSVNMHASNSSAQLGALADGGHPSHICTVCALSNRPENNHQLKSNFPRQTNE